MKPRTRFVPMDPLVYQLVLALARRSHVSVDAMAARLVRVALRRWQRS